MRSFGLKLWQRRYWILITFVCLITTVFSTIWAGSYYWKFDPTLIDQSPQSELYFDRHQELMYAKLNSDEEWRLHVPLKKVSPFFLEAMIATEDRRFYDHSGVDLKRTIKASLQNMRSGKIISGASTISMQLVKQFYPRQRSFKGKFIELCRTLNMERNCSKKWILEQYVNNISFGSNLIGVEAASRYYFGKNAHELDYYEATLLSGLPQRPSHLRPDRHPEKAQNRQKWVQYYLNKDKKLRQESELSLYDREQYFSIEALAKKHSKIGVFSAENQLLLSQTLKGNKSSIDLNWQRQYKKILIDYLKPYPNVNDSALVIIDNKSQEILTMIGSLDYKAEQAGKVNAALAPRSPGSLLKPFIYLLAMDKGMIIPETKLNDKLTHYQDYRPRNYNRQFNGLVTAQEALCQSLNIPAIKLVENIGIEESLQYLRDSGINGLNKEASHYGLSMILGGGESNLLELCRSYSKLFNNKTANHQILRKILSSHQLPRAQDLNVAWKTGTSNGLRDAWSIGYTDRYTIGVWCGNKSGRAANTLTGRKIAAPLLGEIFTSLYQSKASPAFITDQTLFKDIQICENSGLRSKPSCKTTQKASCAKETSLNYCSGCQISEQAKESIKLISPRRKVYYSPNGKSLNLQITVKGAQEFTSFLNGKKIDLDLTSKYSFPIGKHQLSILSNKGHILKHSMEVK